MILELVLDQMKLTSKSNLSSEQMSQLAEHLVGMAKEVRKTEPSYKLALAHGVQDVGYNTVRHGWVSSYNGEATLRLEDGSSWKAVGRKPQGNAEIISKQGFIEFFKLS